MSIHLMGGALRSSHVDSGGVVIAAFEFGGDDEYQLLTRLTICRVGKMMRGTQQIHGHGQAFKSTLMTSIQRIEPP